MIQNPLSLKYGLQAGGLTLQYTQETPCPTLLTPPWHAGFQVPENQPFQPNSASYSHQLALTLVNQQLDRDARWQRLVQRNEIWELWTDEAESLVFTNPLQKPFRRLVIDPRFSAGFLYGDFETPSPVNYPLTQALEIVLFVNWLGNFGDVVLHASGIALDGRGYAFVGPSGVGKSTLARSLFSEPGLRVLGEDQLILRWMDDRFWVFGTPWHEHPEMRSPLGVPLQHIFFLEQDKAEGKAPIAPLEGVSRLLQTAFIPYYQPALVRLILERLNLLAQSIPMNTLSYRLGARALDIILN